MLPHSEMQELAKIACALIQGRSEGLCATLAVLPIDPHSKGTESFDIVIDPARVAPCGELLRVDDCLSYDETARLQFFDLFIRCLEPFIKTFGQIRIVRDKPPNRLVVLPCEPRADHDFSHSAVLYASAETLRPEIGTPS